MTTMRRQGVYISTKVFENINCVFRTWDAEHPKDRMLKAHHLKLRVVFECHYLDQGFIILNDDHDCLKEFVKMLDRHFNNKTVVALDDPEMSIFQALDHKGVIFLSTLPNVSPEKIAEEVFNWFKVWLINSGLIERVDVRSVEVTDNGQHAASYVE